MDFVAIDLETANADMASICQIGIARFEAGQLVEEWMTLVDPEDYFAGMNVAIHGIDADMVRGQRKLPDVYEKLVELLRGRVTVSHTHFDRVALSQAFAKHDLQEIDTSWLDSARVARRTWSELAQAGYGLKNICARIGYVFRHHDALEDAKAAGHVLLAALRESQLDLPSWFERVRRPINLSRLSQGAAIHRDGNPEGDFYGEVLVFTGALQLPRVDAAELAASVGCQVDASVTKKTSILVVGDQDVAKLVGYEKSSKHRKAEELAAKGQQIRIIRESDFKVLVGQAMA